MAGDTRLVMAAGEGALILGIDIGTTSLKVCLVDPLSKQVISKQAKDTQANVPSDLGSEGNKQDVPKIISALNSCVSRLPKDQLKQVRDILCFISTFLNIDKYYAIKSYPNCLCLAVVHCTGYSVSIY